MGEGDALASLTVRPTINLPPRSTFDNWFPGGVSGDSPGPLSLVSSFFSDNNYPDSSKCFSFTQLLAGAMASPVAVAAGLSPSFFMGNSAEDSVKEVGSNEDGGDENLGFKEKRPSSLVVASSSVFMVPPGMSPSGLLNSPGLFSPGQSPFGMSHQQALAQVTAHAVLSQSHLSIQTDPQLSMPSPSDALNPIHLPSSIPNLESSEISNSAKKAQPPSIDKPADDGYNWRKYGQKQVKGSEFPRSYYKCTHSNCPVKKKVERSLTGPITEIIYKGKHNHESPQSNRHAKDNDGDRNIVVPRAMKESTHTDSVHAPMQSGGESEGLQRRSQMGGDDEPNPKKRSVEVGKSEPIPSSQKPVSEARIIVQTRSEVNLLDDGYKWRKYGQKIVKGNHHPRSYYKCTSQECKVRKHVERAVSDPSAVITTYEGKHNHNIPLQKNTNHSISKLKPNT